MHLSLILSVVLLSLTKGVVATPAPDVAANTWQQTLVRQEWWVASLSNIKIAILILLFQESLNEGAAVEFHRSVEVSEGKACKNHLALPWCHHPL